MHILSASLVYLWTALIQGVGRAVGDADAASFANMNVRHSKTLLQSRIRIEAPAPNIAASHIRGIPRAGLKGFECNGTT